MKSLEKEMLDQSTVKNRSPGPFRSPSRNLEQIACTDFLGYLKCVPYHIIRGNSPRLDLRIHTLVDNGLSVPAHIDKESGQHPKGGISGALWSELCTE